MEEYIYDYKIVKAATPEELTKKVKAELDNDFEPQGGPVEFAGELCQAMIQLDEE